MKNAFRHPGITILTKVANTVDVTKRDQFPLNVMMKPEIVIVWKASKVNIATGVAPAITTFPIVDLVIAIQGERKKANVIRMAFVSVMKGEPAFARRTLRAKNVHRASLGPLACHLRTRKVVRIAFASVERGHAIKRITPGPN